MWTDKYLSSIKNTKIIKCKQVKGLIFFKKNGIPGKFKIERMYKGKRINKVLGDVHELNCEDAIAKAIEILYSENSHKKNIDKMILKDAIRYYLNYAETRDSKNTYKSKRTTYQKYLSHLEYRKLSELTSGDILAKLKDSNIKNNTYNENVSRISTMLSWCILNNLSKKNVLQGYLRKKKGSSEKRYISADEFNLILKEIKNPNIELLLKFLVATGMRITDALSLKIDNVDLIQKTIIFTVKKTGKKQAVPISKYIFKEFKIACSNANGNCIFNMDYFTVYREFRNACESVDLYNITLHDLRRTLASWMSIKGADINVISEVLGHVNLRHVKIYAKLNTNVMRNSIDNAIEKFF